MATPVKKLPQGKKGPITPVKSLKDTGATKAPTFNAGKGVKGVSTGKTGGSKKLASKATHPKKNAGASSIMVGTSAPAKLGKGMKKTKGFRSPYNQ